MSSRPAGTSTSASRTGGRNCRTSTTSPSGVTGTIPTAWCLWITSYSPTPGQVSTSTRRYAPAQATREAAGSATGSARNGGGSFGGAPRALVGRRADERAEQRMRARRPRPQLRVELPGDEERVVGQLDDLGQPTLLRRAADHHPAGLQGLVVARIDLPAVAVALLDHVGAVGRGRAGAGLEVTGLRAEAHARDEVGHVLLFG